MFYLQIPCYKLYKENLFSYVLTLKYMCHFGMNLKEFNPRAKHNASVLCNSKIELQGRLQNTPFSRSESTHTNIPTRLLFPLNP
jgi:hypothetical protein